MDKIKVLLVEDDEDDYILTRDLLAGMGEGRFELDWAPAYAEALPRICSCSYDVCLLDYRLGARSGFELLREARARGFDSPVILLTGHGDRELDLQAMAAGVADYLPKSELTGTVLERSIRYALAQQRMEQERIQHACEQEARRQAEAANRAKDEFLALISHELRSPLNAILSWAELLSENVDAALVARAVTSIRRSAEQQRRLVDDLLDHARVITGKLRVEVRPLDLGPVVEAALEGVRAVAEAKRIELHPILDPRSEQVTGNPVRLQEVISNLLSNAIKFTPQGGRVELTLTWTDRYARITVSDTGTGISPEFLPYVFDRFSQADSGAGHRHGGLGLGLALVRHIVELHDGQVRAESPGEGQGATFTVDLPLRATPERADGNAITGC